MIYLAARTMHLRSIAAVLLMLASGCATTRPRTDPPVEPSPSSENVTPVASSTTATASVARAQPAATARPEATPAQKERARALLEQGRVLQRERGEGGAEEAIALYRSAIDSDPNLAAAYWEMGWSHQLLSQWDRVIEAWDRVRELDPAFPELSVHYPVALMRRDQDRVLASLPDPGQLPPPEETPREGPRVRISAVGDVQLGMAWPEERAQLPPNDAKDLLAQVIEPLNQGDITFGNLETVLADSGDSSKCGPRSTKCFAFRVPANYAFALKEAGFEVMSTANNHSGDFGPEGRVATMQALDAAGILHSGVVGDIASWETKGLKLAMVGFSTGAGVYRVQEVDVARKVVADLDRTHDLVIVSFHGGAEGTKAAHVPQGPESFYGEDRGNLRELTHAVIDAGADLVLGHGPHLWRGLELYRGRLIAYSMGNFCTWETFNLTGPLGITGVLQVELAPNGVATEISISPVIIEKPGAPRPDPDRKVIPIVRQLSKEDFGDALLDESGRWKWTPPKPRS